MKAIPWKPKYPRRPRVLHGGAAYFDRAGHRPSLQIFGLRVGAKIEVGSVETIRGNRKFIKLND